MHDPAALRTPGKKFYGFWITTNLLPRVGCAVPFLARRILQRYTRSRIERRLHISYSDGVLVHPVFFLFA